MSTKALLTLSNTKTAINLFYRYLVKFFVAADIIKTHSNNCQNLRPLDQMWTATAFHVVRECFKYQLAF